jgi:hypothetical protein
MADGVPSQANFIGWLALGLIAFAVVVALVVVVSGLNAPAL